MFNLPRALAAFAASLLFLVSAPAMAQPAMWVIRDQDSTIYLFGTIHILKPDTVWKTEKFETAFKSADELWLEINDTDDKAATQQLVMKLGMDPANPLSKRLTPEEWARFTAATGKLGVPATALDPMKPWLAGVTLSIVPMLKAGFDPEKGVDNILKADARTAGKTLRAFETSEQQLKFFDHLPPEAQVAFLMSNIDDLDEGPDALGALIVHWAAGDTKALEDEMVTPMRDEYPALYRLLLIDRNAAWADVIEERLAGKGVSFIAVGSAHLIGPDSVQVLLARKGVKAERF